MDARSSVAKTRGCRVRTSGRCRSNQGGSTKSENVRPSEVSRARHDAQIKLPCQPPIMPRPRIATRLATSLAIIAIMLRVLLPALHTHVHHDPAEANCERVGERSSGPDHPDRSTLLRCITTATPRCTNLGKEAPPNEPFRIPFQRAPRETRNGTRSDPSFAGLCPAPRGFGKA